MKYCHHNVLYLNLGLVGPELRESEQQRREREEEEQLEEAIRLSMETFGKIMLNISDYQTFPCNLNCFADFNISAGEQTREEDEEEEMLRKAIRMSLQED